MFIPLWLIVEAFDHKLITTTSLRALAVVRVMLGHWISFKTFQQQWHPSQEMASSSSREQLANGRV